MKKKLNIILSFFVVALMTVGLVAADTLTIRPNGQGYRTQWANAGCTSANEWQCVDESVANTSDYLYTTGTGRETFLFSDTGLSSETINSVTLNYYAAWQTSSLNSCFAAMTRTGITDYLSEVQLCVDNTYQTKSYTYNTNPATGLAWTVTEVNNLQAGMYGLNPKGGGKVAQVYAVVDYNPLNTCSETDGGANIFLQGQVFGLFGGLSYSYTDYCLDSIQLEEYACHNGNYYSYVMPCNLNITEGICVNGACQNAPSPQCNDGIDNDGDGFIDMNDAGCVSLSDDDEYNAPILVDTCTETDGGIRIYLQGNVFGLFNGQQYSYTDYCIDSAQLEEYYCVGNNYYSFVTNCGSNQSVGCLDGACQ